MNGIQQMMDFLDAQDQKDIKRITHRLLGRLRELDRDEYEAMVLHEFEDWGPEGLEIAEDRINELQQYWENMVEDEGELPDETANGFDERETFCADCLYHECGSDCRCMK